MRLTYRKADKDDFAGFYRILFAQHQQDEGLKAIVHAEWDIILANPTTLCMVVEDVEKPVPTRIAGIAQTVFVTDAFVYYVKSGVGPYAIQHATRSLPDGSRPLLTLEQARAANSGEGLNAFTTRWGWDDTLPDTNQRLQIREFLDQKYALFYRGYQIKETLIEAMGDWPRRGLEMAGYKLRSDYAAHYKSTGETPTADTHPYLMGLTRKEAREEEGSHASRVFAYTPPRFRFKPDQQELLSLALDGFSDDEAALRLAISKEAVRKRWAGIYDWLQESSPGFLPARGETGRGAEKRRALLHYLRDHPEELRPILSRR